MAPSAMNALNGYQWTVFVAVVFMGVLVSLGVQQLFMQVFLNPDKVAKDAARRVGGAALDYRTSGHIGTGLQGWVGAMEIILYSTSIVFRHPEFIAVWLGTKYIAAYKTWGREPVGRSFYNRSLFGSGLNILLGAATGGVALRAIGDTKEQFSAPLRIGTISVRGGTMLELVGGAIIAIIITIVVENLRRPSLTLSIEVPVHDGTYHNAPANNVRFLRVSLLNKPLSRWAQWMVRAPALQCRGTITFHHLDGQNVFGRAMSARWSSSPEPVPIPAVNAEGLQFQIFDAARLTTESRIDVYPGEHELLDVAVRLDDDQECYGWNNETYFCSTPWRNPNWRLPSGRYLVNVTVTSSGQKCVGNFRLINDVARTDFRLELAS